MHQCPHGLRDEFWALVIAIGACLPKRGNGGVDQTRIEAFESGIAQLQLVQISSRKTLDQDVALLGQALQYQNSGLALDIQGDALFPGVQIEERSTLLYVGYL